MIHRLAGRLDFAAMLSSYETLLALAQQADRPRFFLLSDFSAVTGCVQNAALALAHPSNQPLHPLLVTWAMSGVATAQLEPLRPALNQLPWLHVRFFKTLDHSLSYAQRSLRAHCAPAG
ncbi:MAG: hypothetical protein HC915_17795 [Anaerolineae bacterium]|nr:hypothetical protein [Anaerolineae bacterium]